MGLLVYLDLLRRHNELTLLGADVWVDKRQVLVDQMSKIWSKLNKDEVQKIQIWMFEWYQNSIK